MRYAAMPPASARRAAVRRPPVLLILRGRTLVRCVPAERWLMSTILCEGQVQSIYTLDKAALDLDRRPPPEEKSPNAGRALLLRRGVRGSGPPAPFRPLRSVGTAHGVGANTMSLQLLLEHPCRISGV